MANTKLIFAYDYSVFDQKKMELLKAISPHIDLVKVGLQAMTAFDQQGVSIAYKVQRYVGTILQKKVMWDAKLHDIGNTAGLAAHNIAGFSSVQLGTLHASMSNEGLRAVADAWTGKITPLAVTVLTDIDDGECHERFSLTPASVAVENFTRIAHYNGINGFVCSAKEAHLISDISSEATIVTPAIRPEWAVKKDEQKRVTTPTQAALAGADYIVVGRPISNPPEGKTPEQAASEIREELLAA